jgi:DNA invertase Pin-like site-specific DNA recombinase
LNTRKYGYQRVSTKEQNTDRQFQALLDAGVEERFIFTDKQSGKDFLRPQYQVLKNALRSGDCLIVKEISRLGRNYTEILQEWSYITKEIGADIIVLDMPLLDTTQSKDLLGSFVSDIVLQILSFVADNERTEILKRQKDGIAAARRDPERWKNYGRPNVCIPPNFPEIYNRWQNREISAVQAMKILNLKKTTFYKFVKDFREKGYGLMFQPKTE